MKKKSKKSSNYYDDELDYYNLEHEKNDVIDYFILSQQNYVCRRCDINFSFNSWLHKHIRVECNVLLSTIANFIESNFVETNSTTYYVVDANFNETFVIFSTTNNDVNQNYDFRQWHYIIAKIKFNLKTFAKFVCLNIECDITLIDRQFLLTQLFNIIVYIKFKTIFVIDIDENKHEITQYVTLFIFVSNIDKNDKIVIKKITREAHIIDDLKIKMLIDINIMRLKKIDVFISFDQVFIDNCQLTTLIKLQTSQKRRIKQIIQIDKVIVISFHSQFVVSIRRFNKLSLLDRDFLFELIHCHNVFLYAHIVDAFVDVVLTRNEIDKLVILSRKYWFDTLNELSYNRCCNLAIENNDLIIKSSKIVHRSSWLKKLCVTTLMIIDVVMFTLISQLIIFIFFSIVDDIDNVVNQQITLITIINNRLLKQEITLINDVKIYHDNSTIQSLIEIVNDYSNLWKNRDFVDLSRNE